VKKMNG